MAIRHNLKLIAYYKNLSLVIVLGFKLDILIGVCEVLG